MGRADVDGWLELLPTPPGAVLAVVMEENDDACLDNFRVPLAIVVDDEKDDEAADDDGVADDDTSERCGEADGGGSGEGEIEW